MDEADRQQHGEPARIDERRAAAAGRAPSSRPSWRWKPMPNSSPNIRLNLPANSRSRSQCTQASSGASSVAGAANSESAEARHVHNEDAEQGDAAQHVERRDALGGRQAAPRLRRGFGCGVHGPTVANAARRAVGAKRQRGIRSMFEPPSPAACPSPRGSPRPRSSGPSGKPRGPELERAKADATLLWLKVQEDAGLTSSATASSRASTSCTASSPRSKASTSSTR